MVAWLDWLLGKGAEPEVSESVVVKAKPKVRVKKTLAAPKKTAKVKAKPKAKK